MPARTTLLLTILFMRLQESKTKPEGFRVKTQAAKVLSFTYLSIHPPSQRSGSHGAEGNGTASTTGLREEHVLNRLAPRFPPPECHWGKRQTVGGGLSTFICVPSTAYGPRQLPMQVTVCPKHTRKEDQKPWQGDVGCFLPRP